MLPLQIPMLPFLLLLASLAADVEPRRTGAMLPSGDLAGCRLESDLAAYQPGDVALVLASCDDAPAHFRARSGGATVPFFPLLLPATALTPGATPAAAQAPAASAPALLGALVGIDVATQPGTSELVWSARLEGGATAASGALILAVEPRIFPLQRLRVAPRFVRPEPSALPRIARERRRVERALATRTPERLWQSAFVSPVAGGYGRGFGARRVLNGRPSSPHTGLDIAAPEGTPVVAANAGIVVLADTLYYAGRSVIVDHGLGLFTTYSHLSAKSVMVGDRVERGQLVGRVGASGRVTGPHLHWAVHLNGARVDPLSLMAATGGRRRPQAPPPETPAH